VVNKQDILYYIIKKRDYQLYCKTISFEVYLSVDYRFRRLTFFICLFVQKDQSSHHMTSYLTCILCLFSEITTLLSLNNPYEALRKEIHLSYYI
jgi:hypothetical protein